MRLTKRQAAERLGCSVKTIENRIKQGKLHFEKMPDTVGNGWKGNARVWINLPDPQPVSIPTIAQPQPIADRAPQVTVAQEKSFAEKYLSGEACDSLGNRHDSVARKSLLGPVSETTEQASKSNPTSHMHPALVGTPGHERVENPIDSDEYQERIHPGHLERKAELYRLCGVRPLSEQQQKEFNDKRQIHAAFRWAR